MSKVYTVLLVICGLIVTAFILFATGNITIKTEPASETSSDSSAKLAERKVVYVLDNEQLPSEQAADVVRG